MLLHADFGAIGDLWAGGGEAGKASDGSDGEGKLHGEGCWILDGTIEECNGRESNREER